MNPTAAYVSVIVVGALIWFLLNRWFDARDDKRLTDEQLLEPSVLKTKEQR